MNINKIITKYKSSPQAVRASFWFLICAFLQKGISFITTPIFTRLLSITEFGEFSVFNSWLSITTVIVSLNLFSGVYTMGLIKFDDEKNKYSSSLQGLCLTLVIIWTIIYLIFHSYLNEFFSMTTTQMLLMLLIIWTSSVFNFWSVEQRVEFKYRGLVIVTVIVSFAKPLIGIFFVTHSVDKVTARIFGIAIIELIAYTGFFILQMRRGRIFYSKRFWKHALVFNVPLLPHYISMTILSSADRIMINKMDGPDAAGIYNLAYSVSLIMVMFNNALLQTIEPWMYKKIKSKQVKDIANIAYPVFIIIASLNIILIAFAPEVISIFAPIQYRNAIWVIPPVAMSVYFMFAYTFFAVFEFYYEKTQYITIATIVGAILNIVLNFIFIPIFGYYAAGYTTLFCYIIYTVFHFCFMKKICRENLNELVVYDTKILLIITLCFMILSFMFLLLYHNITLRYIMIIALIVYSVIKRKRIFIAIYKIKNIKHIDK